MEGCPRQREQHDRCMEEKGHGWCGVSQDGGLSSVSRARRRCVGERIIGYQSVGHRHLPHGVVIQCNFHGAQDSIACVPGTAVPTGLSLRWCPGVSGGV